MSHRISVSVALGIMLAASNAWPHHNMTALFDLNDRVTFTGTFTKVDWRNPHIQFFVEAKNDKAQMETWAIEGPPPSFFRTRDIGKTDFEGAVGKTVTVEASRARDHSTSGLLRVLTLPDGKAISACPQNC
ncbi:MAG: hypothetical protein JWO19_4459 [Bryobacterales bacterium]|nr:hypothetical protein [Bryobacterales bacterium]